QPPQPFLTRLHSAVPGFTPDTTNTFLPKQNSQYIRYISTPTTYDCTDLSSTAYYLPSGTAR
ncbi:MAG: hypothetical protein Q9180_003668, partial [Flavoplaca navasiana]